jgi:hypothetical protein
LNAAKPGTDTWNELNRQLGEAQKNVDRIMEDIQNMDTSESFKQNMIDAAKNSERVVDAQNKAALATAKTADKEKEHAKRLAESKAIIDQMVRSLTHMFTMWATDVLANFWRNGWDYAHQYYDLLNEIRIVTGQSEDEANAMGESYRKMAKEMSASSTDIASAAVEFWRQGLDGTEVNARLINTTQYAKVSGLEFKEAAELVTSATNSMS